MAQKGHFLRVFQSLIFVREWQGSGWVFGSEEECLRRMLAVTLGPTFGHNLLVTCRSGFL